MSKDLNQCNFIGRLGKDVDIKFMPNGNAVANFSIACGNDYKDKSGDKIEQTNWINVVAFGKLAEICGQYLHKGSKVFISGRFQTRKWQDQSGNDRYSTEIVVDIGGTMQMLDSKGGDGGQAKASSQSQAYQHASGTTGQGRAVQQPAQGNGDMVDDGFDQDISF